MSDIKIDISELVAFQNQIATLDKKIKNKVCKDIAKSLGTNLEKLVIKSTPVITGTLRRNWKTKGFKIANGYQVTVLNQTEYAPYVEYGHRIVRNKKTIGFVKGRYMLTRATQKIRETAIQHARKILKRVLKEHFNGK